MKKLSLVLKSILGLGLLATLSSPLMAAAPGKISYQGKLADSSGVPVDGPKSVIVSICRDSGGTDCPYIEDEGSVSFNDGLFNLVIGESASPGPIPVSLFNGTDRWLKISVGGKVFSPLQKLVSAPYALAVADGSITNSSIASGAALSLSKIDFSGATDNVTLASDKNFILQGHGKVILPEEPTSNTDAANKQYVDRGTKTVDDINPWQNSSGNAVLKTGIDHVGVGTTPDSSMKLDVNGAARFGSTSKSTFTETGSLQLAPSANLELTNGHISGLTLAEGDPIHYAATKGYVDSRTSDVAGSNAWKEGSNIVALKNDNFRVGVGTGVVASDLKMDVEGAAQFGEGLSKSKFDKNGGLTLATGSGIALNGGSITGLGSPSAETDAVSKSFVDAATNTVLTAIGSVDWKKDGDGVVALKNDSYRVGVGTGVVDPGLKMDVEGAAQFGTGSSKSKFDTNGDLTMASGSGVLVKSDGVLNVLGEARFGSTTKSTFTTTGNLMMGNGTSIALLNGSITGLSPLSGSEPGDSAATKQYVDDKTAGGSSGWTTADGKVALTTVGDRVGIGVTPGEGAKLDVEGVSQFGAGVLKSSFTSNGSLILANKAGVTFDGGAISGLSSLSVNGPISSHNIVRDLVPDDTIDSSHNIFLGKNAEQIDVYLPRAADPENDGRIFTVIKFTGNNIVFHPAVGSEKINGASSKTVDTNDVTLTFIRVSETDWVMSQATNP